MKNVVIHDFLGCHCKLINYDIKLFFLHSVMFLLIFDLTKKPNSVIQYNKETK